MLSTLEDENKQARYFRPGTNLFGSIPTRRIVDKLVSHPRCVRHESTIGAGLPVISSINRIISSGYPIHRIVGSLSVEDAKPLSQVVKSAKSLGYTEPDPRDDLNGMDVARKIESLYPEEMGPRCEVGIQELPKNSALGRLRGSDNLASSSFLLSYIDSFDFEILISMVNSFQKIRNSSA
ncbi:hypothetical protein CRYUN_Cryun11dG0140300 [Craigia yunnanensis]